VRLPPIAWAGIVTVVVLAVAITAGILLGPGTSPACGTTPSATSAASPAACATVSPTP
jgi:hypothetical protein